MGTPRLNVLQGTGDGMSAPACRWGRAWRASAASRIRRTVAPQRARGSPARGRDTGPRLSPTCGCRPGSVHGRVRAGTDLRKRRLCSDMRTSIPAARSTCSAEDLRVLYKVSVSPCGGSPRRRTTACDTAPLEQLSRGLQNKIIVTKPRVSEHPAKSPYSILSGGSGQPTAPGQGPLCLGRLPDAIHCNGDPPTFTNTGPPGFTGGGQSYCLGYASARVPSAKRSLTL